MDEKVEAVRRMQKYIDGHLEENITPADLAAASMFSPWYARRIFEQYVGMSPAKYIRRLKLSKSALRLRDEKCKVLDAAMDLGFGSVDGYQRAFQSEFGLNPKEYAMNPIPICLFIPYPVESTSPERREQMDTVKTIFIQKVMRPARKVIVKRGIKSDNYWDYCNEVGCDVWGLLTSIPSITGEPVCLWLPESLRDLKENVYVQGTEVSTGYDGVVPDGFDVIALPEAEYLMFQGEPFAEEDYDKAIQEIWTAEEKYDPSVIGYQWDDSNPKIQLEPIGERGYIELKPIKKRK